MLTPSVNIVQSSFPEEKQGEISGVSRSISNLGSSFGTAIAGTILVSDLASGNRTYVLAMISLGALALVGLAAAMLLPANIAQETASPRVGSQVVRRTWGGETSP
jgi:nitrate/nitrite transporter NarK